MREIAENASHRCISFCAKHLLDIREGNYVRRTAASDVKTCSVESCDGVGLFGTSSYEPDQQHHDI